MADMWIHESFTNYSESLFLEFHYGKEKAFEYIEAESGKHFDPNLVALTVSIRKNIESTRLTLTLKAC